MSIVSTSTQIEFSLTEWSSGYVHLTNSLCVVSTVVVRKNYVEVMKYLANNRLAVKACSLDTIVHT